ncbi:hypothetical protein FCV25MIE_29667 [Fagus crenata]
MPILASKSDHLPHTIKFLVLGDHYVLTSSSQVGLVSKRVEGYSVGDSLSSTAKETSKEDITQRPLKSVSPQGALSIGSSMPYSIQVLLFQSEVGFGTASSQPLFPDILLGIFIHSIGVKPRDLIATGTLPKSSLRLSDDTTKTINFKKTLKGNLPVTQRLLDLIRQHKEAFETYGMIEEEVEGALDMLESDIVCT